MDACVNKRKPDDPTKRIKKEKNLLIAKKLCIIQNDAFSILNRCYSVLNKSNMFIIDVVDAKYREASVASILSLEKCIYNDILDINSLVVCIYKIKAFNDMKNIESEDYEDYSHSFKTLLDVLTATAKSDTARFEATFNDSTIYTPDDIANFDCYDLIAKKRELLSTKKLIDDAKLELRTVKEDIEQAFIINVDDPNWKVYLDIGRKHIKQILVDLEERKCGIDIDILEKHKICETSKENERVLQAMDSIKHLTQTNKEITEEIEFYKKTLDVIKN